MEAFEREPHLPDGIYELPGPKAQDNPEGSQRHQLLPHGSTAEPDAPRTFEGLREWFQTHNEIEGLVFHHPDGRMAKIKLCAFGIKRAKAAAWN
jgi:hypothetical protein